MRLQFFFPYCASWQRRALVFVSIFAYFRPSRNFDLGPQTMLHFYYKYNKNVLWGGGLRIMLMLRNREICGNFFFARTPWIFFLIFSFFFIEMLKKSEDKSKSSKNVCVARVASDVLGFLQVVNALRLNCRINNGHAGINGACIHNLCNNSVKCA